MPIRETYLGIKFNQIGWLGMVYETFLTENFFSKVTTENQAVNILRGLKFDGMDFKCPACGVQEFYPYRCNIEIRKCCGSVRSFV